MLGILIAVTVAHDLCLLLLGIYLFLTRCIPFHRVSASAFHLCAAVIVALTVLHHGSNFINSSKEDDQCKSKSGFANRRRHHSA